MLAIHQHQRRYSLAESPESLTHTGLTEVLQVLNNSRNDEKSNWPPYITAEMTFSYPNTTDRKGPSLLVFSSVLVLCMNQQEVKVI